MECSSNLSFKRQQLKKLIFVHLNINSIWNKSELPINQIKSAVDVLMISESKIDDSFLIANFLTYGFTLQGRSKLFW